MGVDELLASLRPGGRDFERLCKWLLENVPTTGSNSNRSGSGTTGPDSTGGTLGSASLPAENREGGLWAIQAKHYDPLYAIKKADVDSFLSALSRGGVHAPAADRDG